MINKDMKHWINPCILFDTETNIVRIKITEMLIFMYDDEPWANAMSKCFIDLPKVLKNNYTLIKDATIIVDSTWEPLDPTPFVNCILKMNCFSEDKILVQESRKVCNFKNTETFYTGLCNQFSWYDILQEYNIDWECIEVDKHLVALARRPTVFRAEFMKLLLDAMPEYTRASFGNLDRPDSFYDQYRKIMDPHLIPMILDGNQHRLISAVHSPKKGIVYKSLVNVALETSVDFLFVTEKTYKAFAWHQIPICFASVGHIAKLRELGFDVFDDLLGGHAYDTEANLHLRQLKILATLKNIVKTDDIQGLRKSIWPRLVENNKRLSDIVEQERSRFDPRDHLNELKKAGLKAFT
jgi:hypothetical protein